MNLTSLEKRKERQKLWAKNNPEKVRASVKKWREANTEKTKQHKTNWLQVPENRIRHSLSQAKRRATEKGIEFAISIDDLLPLPTVCCVLNVPLNYKGTKNRGFVNDCPSIDRIDPTKGYVPGNVQIISWRANRIKSDASILELESVLKYMKGFEKCN